MCIRDRYGLCDWKLELDHAKVRAGACHFTEKKISFSRNFIKHADDLDINDTILHEIAHALVGPNHGHDSVWKKALGANISAPQILTHHGVKVIFVEAPNTKVELLEPLNKNSPISRFLEKNPNGGMHHICYEVKNLKSASKKLEAVGARILGDGLPKIGAHGNPVIFLNPKDFSGTLIELEEIE